jgi:transposase
MLYSPNEFDVFIGIDVDQKSFAFTVKNHDTMSNSYKIPASPENLYQHIRNRYNTKRVICAYEVGVTGYHLHDYLTSKNIRCLMVPPPSVPKASNDRTKNNRLDSERISQNLKNGDMLPIRVPDYDCRELRQLLRSREEYVNMRKVAKQRIKSLLLFAHLHVLLKDTTQYWSYLHIRRLKELPCSPATRQRLDLLLKDLEYSRAQTVLILKELKKTSEQNEKLNRNIHYLRSIPGIGFITAITVLAAIGDPEQLRNPRELSAFVGLVPSEYSTGERISRGHITRLGSSILRSLLVEAAWANIAKDARLRQFYDRIRAKHHPQIGSRKAIVAVARKLTLIIYRVLKEQREYIANI